MTASKPRRKIADGWTRPCPFTSSLTSSYIWAYRIILCPAHSLVAIAGPLWTGCYQYSPQHHHPPVFFASNSPLLQPSSDAIFNPELPLFHHNKNSCRLLPLPERALDSPIFLGVRACAPGSIPKTPVSSQRPFSKIPNSGSKCAIIGTGSHPASAPSQPNKNSTHHHHHRQSPLYHNAWPQQGTPTPTSNARKKVPNIQPDNQPQRGDTRPLVPDPRSISPQIKVFVDLKCFCVFAPTARASFTGCCSKESSIE
jgi:hypothetical protein